MQKTIWNTDGTAKFGEPVSIDTKIAVPSGA